MWVDLSGAGSINRRLKSGPQVICMAFGVGGGIASPRPVSLMHVKRTRCGVAWVIPVISRSDGDGDWPGSGRCRRRVSGTAMAAAGRKLAGRVKVRRRRCRWEEFGGLAPICTLMCERKWPADGRCPGQSGETASSEPTHRWLCRSYAAGCGVVKASLHPLG